MIIDTDDYAAAGIETFFFPGGEPHAKVEEVPAPGVTVHAKLRTWEDVGRFLAVASALRFGCGRSFATFMPYLPGARQDRRQDGFPETARMFSALFETVGVRRPTCVDPHSPEAWRLYRMPPILQPTWLPELVGKAPDYIVAPDAGGVARAEGAARLLGGVPVLRLTKVRDSMTGKLGGFAWASEPVDLAGARVLVVDDICDGGGTFAGVAEALGAVGKLELYVTHGIFSKGFDGLRGAGYSQIYTTDSFWNGGDYFNLRVAELLPYYLGQ